MKYRFFREHNYKAFYINNKIAHIPFDPLKPIEELSYPEHYLIKLDGAKDPVLKLQSFFGDMTEIELPFSIFIFGIEPTEDKNFLACLKEFYRMGVESSFVTNGSFINHSSRDLKRFLTSVPRFCKEVNVRCDPDGDGDWNSAVLHLMNEGVNINLELDIDSYSSYQYLMDVYETWEGRVKKFILDLAGIEDIEQFTEMTVDKMDVISFKETPNPLYTKVLDLESMQVGPVV